MHFAFDKSRLQTALALIAIISFAAWVRLNGTAWDGYAGLHPDERHLLFTLHDMLRALADPAHVGLGAMDWVAGRPSPLDPHAGERSYVYGELPLWAGLAATKMAGTTDWFEVMKATRIASALADCMTILAVFAGGRLLSGSAGGLFAAVLYATMPTALQLANFYTVDVWQSAFTALSLVAAIALAQRRGSIVVNATVAGIAMGLALASKVTGILLAGPLLVAVVLGWRDGMGHRAAAGAVVFGVAGAILAFRVANPFAFDGASWWLSTDWLDDFAGLADVTASPHFPPNWQWIAGYGQSRLLRDIILFGAGPAASIGFVILLFRHPARWGAVLVPLCAMALFYILASISSVSALRYAAPGLPALAMALAPVSHLVRPGAGGAILALALWWGIGAARLHDGQHPRVAASLWLWTLPQGTVIANETSWDETLPAIVSLAPGEPYQWPNHDDWFRFELLDITAPDTPEKADHIAGVMARTDFLVLSSDRHSAVMPRLPERFPLTTAHYAALVSGEACFAPVLTIDRGYPLPGWRIDDSWAQEPWRIYDHPIVRIFRRETCFDQQAYADLLKAALSAP